MADTKPLQIRTANGDELLYVEGGSFLMGDTRGDGDDFERPAHRVALTYDLYVGKYPVTFEEYDRYYDATEYFEPDDEGMGRGRRPVMNLAWPQAIEYCNWLSEREGLPAAYYPDGNLLDEAGRKTNDITRVAGYRLLTEAEWEYAARGGKKGRGYKYSGSDDIDEVAWYKGNSRSMTRKVGMKKPNELGLHDMSGNVWEWCSDRSLGYSDREETNPHNIAGYRRVIRGGCWFSPAENVRVTCREDPEPVGLYNGVGFRICRISSTGKVEIDTHGSDGPLPVMEFVERGSFRMGSALDGALLDEEPVHGVALSYDFHMGRYEVKFGEYDAFCAATGRQLPPDEGWGRGSRPVINVTWWDAVEYCNWLSKREGLAQAYDDDGNLLDSSGRKTTDVSAVAGYRLPTEAEWEYAASGGKKGGGYKYSGSDDIDEVAWYGGNSRSMTQEVGMKKPNELGLYDMSGNVWEWCFDWYSYDYYDESPEVDPYNGVIGNCDEVVESRRVMRGGNAGQDPTCARVTSRESLEPSAASNGVGFRVCRTATK